MKNYCPGRTNEYLCLHPGFTYAVRRTWILSEGREEVECCYLVLLLSYAIDHVLINLALHYWNMNFPISYAVRILGYEK